MAGLVGKFMMSIQAGISSGWAAARRVYEDPGQAHEQRSWADMASSYSLLWAYYSNEMFDAEGNSSLSLRNLWQMYKSRYALYRDIRMIYNPTTRLVNFYAGQVYPGVLALDGNKLPEGVPLAIPLADDTPDVLKSAIAQFWQWSNWQAKKSVMLKWGAALGSVLIEMVDDLERGKVYASLIWPGFISHLVLDQADNIKEYHLQYTSKDEDGRTYIYRKEVTKVAFRYFKDDQPYAYNGQASAIPNPYGFVPAVWIKHNDIGGVHGTPAMAGTLGKVDQVNSRVSQVHDQIGKVISAPMVLWSSTPIGNMFDPKKRGPVDDDPIANSERENMLILRGGSDGRVDSLAGNLPFGEVMLFIDKALGEIEADHPEITFYEKLREMSQVTGPAAARLMGDVAARVGEAAANYDQGSIRLFQMAIAIAGMRSNNGGWGSRLTRQQQKFLPFDLESYARGDLDFEIMPRPILLPTEYEKMLEEQAKWQGVQSAVSAGVPLEVILRKLGWTEEDVALLGQAQVDKIKRDQLLAQEDTIPAQTQTGQNMTSFQGQMVQNMMGQQGL